MIWEVALHNKKRALQQGTVFISVDIDCHQSHKEAVTMAGVSFA